MIFTHCAYSISIIQSNQRDVQLENRLPAGNEISQMSHYFHVFSIQFSNIK